MKNTAPILTFEVTKSIYCKVGEDCQVFIGLNGNPSTLGLPRKSELLKIDNNLFSIFLCLYNVRVLHKIADKLTNKLGRNIVVDNEYLF